MMIGLVNIVRCCCAPARRPSVLLPALAVFVLVIAVAAAGRAALAGIGSGAGALEAANAAVGAGIALVVKVVLALVGLVAVVWGGWALLEWRRGRRAVATFEAHQRAHNARLEQRRAAALEANRTAATPRQRVASRRTDRATADEVLEARGDRAPVDLDAVIRDGGW